MISVDYNEWLSTITNRTSVYLKKYTDYQSGDIDDWEGKAWAFYEKSRQEGYSGVVFEGKKGTGKHTAFASFLSVYSSDEGLGYSAYVFDRLTLPKNDEEYNLFESYFRQLIRSIREEQKNCVLSFDLIGCSSFVDELLDLLSDVCLFESDEGNSDFKYLIISDKELHTSSVFARVTCRFVFGELTSSQRELFLKSKAKDLIDLVDISVLVSYSEGSTFGELTDAVRRMNMDIIADPNKYSRIDLAEVTINQYVSAKKNKGRRINSLESILNRLDTIVPGTPNATTAPVVQTDLTPVEGNDEDESSFIMRRHNEINDLPPRQLAIEIMGEDKVNEILMANRN